MAQKDTKTVQRLMKAIPCMLGTLQKVEGQLFLFETGPYVADGVANMFLGENRHNVLQALKRLRDTLKKQESPKGA